MTVRYVFENLKSIADYLDTKAKLARESAERFKPRSIKHTQQMEQAATNESLADMLRDTQLRTDADVIPQP
jgi:hypothetical protein